MAVALPADMRTSAAEAIHVRRRILSPPQSCIHRTPGSTPKGCLRLLSPQLPDLLARPLAAPFRRDVVMLTHLRVRGCLEFDQRLHREAAGAEETDPLPVRQVELDLLAA